MFDDIFGYDKESSDVKKFNKNDLLKKLINLDKDNFTEEELVSLLGLSKKEDKSEIKVSGFESEVFDFSEVTLPPVPSPERMEIKSSSIFNGCDLARNIDTAYDSAPKWNENFEYNDSHTENKNAVLNKFREKPDLLQEKREIALLRAIIGYRNPFKPNDRNSDKVCLKDVLLGKAEGDYFEKSIEILDRFLKRTGSSKGLNYDRPENYVNAVFKLFAFYEVEVDVFLYTLLRERKVNYAQLNSSVHDLRYEELNNFLKYHLNASEDILQTILFILENVGNSYHLEDLVFINRRLCGLEEVISKQADLKILSCLRNMLNSKQINPGMNPETKEGYFNEMCVRLDLPYRLENLNDRQSISDALDSINKLIREKIGYSEEYGEPTELDKAKLSILAKFKETRLYKVNAKLDKKLNEI